MGKIVRIIPSIVGKPVPLRDTALKVCFKLGIKIVKITEQRNNFVAHCVYDNDAEKIFDDKSIETLLSIGFELKLLWSLKSARTVIIRKLDEDMLNSSFEEIANE